jgi:hypothetical protein
MPKSYEEITDSDPESLCKYCLQTDRGEHAFSQTPNGYWACEGRWCKDAYETYLEEYEEEDKNEEH